MKRKLNCVLLVDDDPATNFLHTKAIKGADCTEEIATAENGEDAISYLEQRAAQNLPVPELILLDINMPIMNGWDFLLAYQELPQTQKELSKIVMLTTSMNPDDEKRAKTFPEIKEFNFKPLDKAMMHSLIEKHFPELL
jgi:CheY-like chemotaxis protein